MGTITGLPPQILPHDLLRQIGLREIQFDFWLSPSWFTNDIAPLVIREFANWANETRVPLKMIWDGTLEDDEPYFELSSFVREALVTIERIDELVIENTECLKFKGLQLGRCKIEVLHLKNISTLSHSFMDKLEAVFGGVEYVRTLFLHTDQIVDVEVCSRLRGRLFMNVKLVDV